MILAVATASRRRLQSQTLFCQDLVEPFRIRGLLIQVLQVEPRKPG